LLLVPWKCRHLKLVFTCCCAHACKSGQLIYHMYTTIYMCVLLTETELSSSNSNPFVSCNTEQFGFCGCRGWLFVNWFQCLANRTGPSFSLHFAWVLPTSCRHFPPATPTFPISPEVGGGGNLLHLNCTRSGAETVDDVGQPEEFFFCVL